MKLSIEETTKIKDQVIENSKKGFPYFLKNILLVLLMFFGCYIFTNPTIIMNPAEYVENFDRSSIFSIAVLFCVIAGGYQLARSILRESRELTSEEVLQKEKNAKKTHNEEAINRMKKNPQISMVLKDLLINLNASRATVCEIHNGTNTLAGIPFIHLTMTFEEISSEDEYSRDDYNELNMSRIPFISKHFDDGIWVGSTEAIAKEDKFLAAKLTANNDNYMGFLLIHGKEYPLGILTIAFADKDEHPDKATIIKELTKASQKISILLDK